MKKLLMSKKGVAFLATLTVAIVAVVGAYAYFTSTGHDSTMASVGSATQWQVEADALTGGTLYPGQGSNASTGTVTNVGNPNQLLHQIVATINAPTVAEGAPVVAGHACSAADFALSAASGWAIAEDGLSATLTLDQDLEPTGHYDWSGLSVSMLDNAYNQNNCQGATVNLSFDAS